MLHIGRLFVFLVVSWILISFCWIFILSFWIYNLQKKMNSCNRTHKAEESTVSKVNSLASPPLLAPQFNPLQAHVSVPWQSGLFAGSWIRVSEPRLSCAQNCKQPRFLLTTKKKGWCKKDAFTVEVDKSIHTQKAIICKPELQKKLLMFWLLKLEEFLLVSV